LSWWVFRLSALSFPVSMVVSILVSMVVTALLVGLALAGWDALMPRRVGARRPAD
jgi:hypothetical protein